MHPYSRLALAVVSAFAFAILVSTTSSHQWSSEEMMVGSRNLTVWRGPWKICTARKCFAYEEDKLPAWWYAIRACSVLSVMLSFTGFLLAVIMCFMKSLKSYILSVLFMLVVICKVVPLVLWNHKVLADEGRSASWGYGVGWAGVTMALLVVLIGIIDDQIDAPHGYKPTI